MYKLGQRIIIMSDKFEQSLPIGEYGYIIAYDRNADNAFDYVIRVPKANRNFYVPAADIELEEVLIKLEVDKLEREALIDFALATHNAELFHRIMNGDQEPEEEDNSGNEPQSKEDFMRQVRLKAWI
ncbi:ATPase [Paenibacillus rhizovicinus]|uniref:ATPase n=1 Tax=Paenibacillus rhizovicinus TaxID=2704463 RepID=A0A6C0P3T4_9BACL|nr:ATPase [Paenibacillus rhizovicinus]QHW33127.1 ATPase [Paenibacillus rhizovicinus]